MPPRLPPPLHPYRLFHLSARLRLRDRPSPSIPSQQPDDYYSLLLSSPTPTPIARKNINPARAPKAHTNPSANPSTATTTSTKPPDNRVLFSAPLSGPSPRMRGLSRGERGLERPPEPDNCCMSGCVNCVWDAYREEVEEWAAARRTHDHQTAGKVARGELGGRREGVGGVGEDGGGDGVGDMDEVGGLKGSEGVDLGDEGEGGLFEGVPVGIREFMNTEKRLRERRGAERA